MNELQVQLRPVSALIPYAKNARTHSDEQVSQIARSIEEFGWTNPILVDRNNVIIAGHARLLAAKKLKLVEVPIIVLGHLTDAQRRALVIADNQLAIGAGWDEEMLRVELRMLEAEDYDLNLIGFGESELAELLANDGDYAGHADDDAVPEAPEIAVSVLGDLWILGDHRVYCGDAFTGSLMWGRQPRFVEAKKAPVEKMQLAGHSRWRLGVYSGAPWRPEWKFRLKATARGKVCFT